MNGSKEMELRQRAEILVGTAQQIVVSDQTSMENANDFIIRLRSGQKGVVAFFADMKSTAHKAWKTICDKEKTITDIFKSADAIASKKIIAYRNEERRKAQEAARKAEIEAAERRRKEEEKLLRQAVKAEEKGQTEKAEILAEQATQVHVPTAVVEPAVKKTEVSSMGTTTGIPDWDVTVLSPMAVIQAVAAGELPEYIVEVKTSAIKKYAKDQKIKNYNRNGLRIEATERLAAKASYNRG